VAATVYETATGDESPVPVIRHEAATDTEKEMLRTVWSGQGEDHLSFYVPSSESDACIALVKRGFLYLTYLGGAPELFWLTDRGKKEIGVSHDS
jgi:hypothetical protein